MSGRRSARRVRLVASALSKLTRCCPSLCSAWVRQVSAPPGRCRHRTARHRGLWLAESLGGGVVSDEVRQIRRLAQPSGKPPIVGRGVASAAGISFLRRSRSRREIKRWEGDYRTGRARLRTLRDAIARRGPPGATVSRQSHRYRCSSRDNATRGAGRSGDRPGRFELPQRPEQPARPEPPQRPQQPVRPERPAAGRERQRLLESVSKSASGGSCPRTAPTGARRIALVTAHASAAGRSDPVRGHPRDKSIWSGARVGCMPHARD